MAGKSFIHVDGEQIRRLYEVEKLTARQIAGVLGASPRTITRRLHDLGITPRKPGPQRHEQLRNKAWLAAEYAGKSLAQIAREIGASNRVVLSWLEAHGIPRRPRNQHTGKKWGAEVRQRMSEAKKGRLLGAENPNWRGGLVNPNQRLRASHLSKDWSQKVRARDGKCVECGATGRLHAHHVKPWKHHPELRFDLNNGVTLCPACHQKAHGWRFPDWIHDGERRTSAKHSEQG